MATHFSILAWEIPWTEEPGGLQSKGSQKVSRGLEREVARTRPRPASSEPSLELLNAPQQQGGARMSVPVSHLTSAQSAD